MIGGFFVYKIATMDRDQLAASFDQAKQDAAKMQQEKLGSLKKEDKKSK